MGCEGPAARGPNGTLFSVLPTAVGEGVAASMDAVSFREDLSWPTEGEFKCGKSRSLPGRATGSWLNPIEPETRGGMEPALGREAVSNGHEVTAFAVGDGITVAGEPGPEVAPAVPGVLCSSPRPNRFGSAPAGRRASSGEVPSDLTPAGSSLSAGGVNACGFRATPGAGGGGSGI